MNKKLHILLLVNTCVIGLVGHTTTHTRQMNDRHFHKKKCFNLDASTAQIQAKIQALSDQVDTIEQTTRPRNVLLGADYVSCGPVGTQHRDDIIAYHDQIEEVRFTLMKSFYDIKNKIDTLNNQGDRQTIDGIEHRNKTVEKEIQRLIPKLNKLQDHLNKIQSNRVSLTEQSQDMNMIQPVGAQMAATCNDMTCAMPMDTTTDTMNDQMSGDTEYNMTSPIESDMQNTPMAENIMISADTQTMMPSDTVVSPVEEPMPMMDASIQPIVSSQTMPMDNNNSSEVIITNPDAPINTPIPSDQMM